MFSGSQPPVQDNIIIYLKPGKSDGCKAINYWYDHNGVFAS